MADAPQSASPAETTAAPAAGDSLAAEAIDQTLRLAAHLRGRLGDALAAAGINESRMAVLRLVGSRGEAGCSQVEIATAIGQAESSVCTLVDRMKTDGLLVRLRCQVDRRRSLLHLTEAGVLALAAGTEQVAAVASELETLWGRRRLEPLRTLLEEMLFEIERPRTETTVNAAADTSRRAA